MENIYDELDNFERVREYDELKEENVRLHKCIAELEEKITVLTKENARLSASLSNIEKSFAALLKTAKAEIERKTEMIATLNMEKDQLIFRHIGNRNNAPNGRYSKYYGRANSGDTAPASQVTKRKPDGPPSVPENKIPRLEGQNDVRDDIDGSATLRRTKGDENRNPTAVREEDAGCVKSREFTTITTRPNSPRFSSDDESEPDENHQKYAETEVKSRTDKEKTTTSHTNQPGGSVQNVKVRKHSSAEPTRRPNRDTDGYNKNVYSDEEKTTTSHTNQPGGSVQNVKVRKNSSAEPTRRPNRDTDRYNKNVDSDSVNSQNVEKEGLRQRRQRRSPDKYEEGNKTRRKSFQEFDEQYNEKPRFDKTARDGHYPRLKGKDKKGKAKAYRKEPRHRFITSRTRFEYDKIEKNCRSRSPGFESNGRDVRNRGSQYDRDSNFTKRRDAKRLRSPHLGKIRRTSMKQHEPEYHNVNRKARSYERSRSRHRGNDEIEIPSQQSKIVNHEINHAIIDRTKPENICDRANIEIHEKQQSIENDRNEQKREEELCPPTDQCQTVHEQEKQNCDDNYRKCDAIELVRRLRHNHTEQEQTQASQFDRAVIECDGSVGVRVCQSPDEAKGSNRGVTNGNCRIIPDKGQLAVLDDPRLYSEKYFTCEQIHINKISRLASVNELCKFTLNIRERAVDVDLKMLNYKTTTPPLRNDEDLIEDIYNDIDGELSNSSLESGEIVDSDDFDLHRKTDSVGKEPKALVVKEILEPKDTEFSNTIAKQDTVKICVPVHEMGQQFIKVVQGYRIPRMNSTSQYSGTTKVSESECEKLEENPNPNKPQKNNKYKYVKMSKSKGELKVKSDKILANIFQNHTDSRSSGRYKSQSELEEQYPPISKKKYFESQSKTHLRRKQNDSNNDSYKNLDENHKSILDKMLKTVEYEENETNNSQSINSSENETPLKPKDSRNLVRPDNDSEQVKVAKLEERQSRKSFNGRGKEKSSTPNDSTSVIEDNDLTEIKKMKTTKDLKTSTDHNKTELETGERNNLSKCKSSKKFEIENNSDNTSVIEDNDLTEIRNMKTTDDLKTSTDHNKTEEETGERKNLSKCKSTKKFEMERNSGSTSVIEDNDLAKIKKTKMTEYLKTSTDHNKTELETGERNNLSKCKSLKKLEIESNSDSTSVIEDNDLTEIKKMKTSDDLKTSTDHNKIELETGERKNRSKCKSSKKFEIERNSGSTSVIEDNDLEKIKKTKMTEYLKTSTDHNKTELETGERNNLSKCKSSKKLEIESNSDSTSVIEDNDLTEIKKMKTSDDLKTSTDHNKIELETGERKNRSKCKSSKKFKIERNSGSTSVIEDNDLAKIKKMTTDDLKTSTYHNKTELKTGERTNMSKCESSKKFDIESNSGSISVIDDDNLAEIKKMKTTDNLKTSTYHNKTELQSGERKNLSKCKTLKKFDIESNSGSTSVIDDNNLAEIKEMKTTEDLKTSAYHNKPELETGERKNNNKSKSSKKFEIESNSESTSVTEVNELTEIKKLKATDDLTTSTYHNKTDMGTGETKKLSKCKSSKKFEIESNSESTSLIEDNDLTAIKKMKTTGDLKTSAYHNKTELETGERKNLSKCKSLKKSDIESNSGKGSSKTSSDLSTENRSKKDKTELTHEKKPSESSKLSQKASKTSETENKIKSSKSYSKKKSKDQKIKPASTFKAKDKLKQEHRETNSRNHKKASDEHKKETVEKITDLFGENSLITPEDLQDAQAHVMQNPTKNHEREFELNGFNDLVEESVENISTFLRPELNNELTKSREHIIPCKIREGSTEKLCNGSIKEEHRQTLMDDNRDGNTTKEVTNSSSQTVYDHSQSGLIIKIVKHANNSQKCEIVKKNVSNLEMFNKETNKPGITENVIPDTKSNLQSQTKIQDYPSPNIDTNEIPKDMPLISIVDLMNGESNQDTNCKNATNQESNPAERTFGHFLGHYKNIDRDSYTASDCEPSLFATSTPNPKTSPECSSKKVLSIPSPINEISRTEEPPPACIVTAPNENSTQSNVKHVVDPQQANVSPENIVTGRREIRVARRRRIVVKDS